MILPHPLTAGIAPDDPAARRKELHRDLALSALVCAVETERKHLAEWDSGKSIAHYQQCEKSLAAIIDAKLAYDAAAESSATRAERPPNQMED